MKKLIIFQIIICLCAVVSAQTIEYGYDSAGNRVSRKIINLSNPQSAKAAVDSFEEPQKEQLGELGISIYPNPTRGLLKVDFENLPDNEVVNLQVLDMNGRSLLGKTTTDNTEIDLSDKPSGNYLLIILCGNKKSSWKIIKQ